MPVKLFDPFKPGKPSGLIIPRNELSPQYERVILKITRLLLDLNTYYDYTVFWSFWGNTEMFDIDIHPGIWNFRKHPLSRIGLKVAHPFLYDINNDELFDMKVFEKFTDHLKTNSGIWSK